MKKTYIITLLLCLASLATIAQPPSNAVVAEKITNLFVRKQATAEIMNDAPEGMRIILDAHDIYSIHYNSKTREVSLYTKINDSWSLKGDYFDLTPQQHSRLLLIYLKAFKAYQIADSKRKQSVARQLDKL